MLFVKKNTEFVREIDKMAKLLKSFKIAIDGHMVRGALFGAFLFVNRARDQVFSH